MPIIDKLLDLLSPLSIYHITDDSYIMKELKSYGVGFTLCETELQRNIEDGFIETCSQSAMTVFEGACDCDNSDLSAEERRKRLLFLLSVLPNAFNKEKVLDALKAFGYEGTITVDTANEVIILNGVMPNLPIESHRELVNAAEKLLPAHYDYIFSTEPYTWTQFDTLEKSFFQLDNLDYRWNLFNDNDTSMITGGI